MTSLGTARLLLALLALVGGRSDTASAACVDDWSGRWNNLFENTNDSHNIGSASSATSVSLSGEETTDLLDISEYFTVSLNSSGGINLTPKPSLVGVKDYPTNMREIGPGTVTVNCTGTSEEQTVTVKVRDANTASPQLSSSSYLVPVSENYPTQLAIFALNISATDYDGDPTNNAVTFSLEDGTGTFNLTPAEQTSTQPATYLTRLVLNRALDWSRQTEYQLTVTAQDRGGLKSTSDVIINVTDVDNMPPEFGYTGYTAEALDRKALGPLVVKPATISATDPDRGGPLKYTLLDLPSANWARYFALDADSAALSLVKEIPDDVTTPSEISLIVESQETAGELFVSRAVLVVHLTPQEGVPPSDTGYIVGLAVLGCTVLALLVAVGILYRRRKWSGLPPQHNSGTDTDWESARAAAGDAADGPHSRTALNRHSEVSSSAPSAAPSTYDNRAFSAEQPAELARIPEETAKSPPAESSLYPPLPADPPVSAAAQPISGAGAAAQPMGTEGAAPPAEPRPDYAAKSVGFKDTVLCVTPVEAADVQQVDDDDGDEDGDEDGDGDDGDGDGGAGEDGPTASGDESDERL